MFSRPLGMKRGLKVKIKAAVVREKSGPFRIEEVELDESRKDEVFVRVVGCTGKKA